ncbi:hypothetical protein IJG12_00180 [Candidatus Saccharibacteria bacterium]|nr:hypothetical protein [Candidatus Saccharibacteria bacterium]
MLVMNSRIIGTPILSVQAGGPIATIKSAIIDPNDLKILGFHLEGPLVNRAEARILDVRSIREYSQLGMVIDNIEELVAPDDVIKIQNVLELNFDLINLKVRTKKGTKLGHIIDYTLTSEDFIVQQIIVRRPLVKSLVDPELTISRKEIVEITDYEVIIKDEEKVLKARAEKEDFVPNFVNPFREQGFAPAKTDDKKD